MKHQAATKKNKDKIATSNNASRRVRRRGFKSQNSAFPLAETFKVRGDRLEVVHKDSRLWNDLRSELGIKQKRPALKDELRSSLLAELARLRLPQIPRSPFLRTGDAGTNGGNNSSSSNMSLDTTTVKSRRMLPPLPRPPAARQQQQQHHGIPETIDTRWKEPVYF